ncbi:MAG: NAD-dependent epimerase/dehydratase family protein [Thermomonas sp.]
MSTVLVTGGSGFIGGHAIAQLLEQGHVVHASVRDLRREPAVRAMLSSAGIATDECLRFFAADLTDDAGWNDAAHGCDFVLHVASPFPAGIPKHDDELIVPAREGALRVLRAAHEAGVHRVVLTSSFAAVGYGHPEQQQAFDESTWTNLSGHDVSAYVKSKTLAERAAWDFITREGGGLELAVVNPVGVFGPVMSADYATSILLVQKLMDGALPGSPNLRFGVVDVRDVVDLHLRAMTNPAASGERFLAVAGDFMRVQDMARVLKQRMGDAARKVPTRQLPNWMVKLAAFADPTVRQIVPELGKYKNATSAKARDVLGWSPRSNEEALLATAESLLRLGLLKPLR